MSEGTRSNTDGQARLLPTTPMGWWSAKLLAAAAGVFAVAVIVSLLVAGGAGDAGEPSDAIRFVIGFSFLLTGLGTLVTAAIAVIRDRERSVLGWLALLLGFAATAFVLGDIVVPR
jgi:uncharacterized membrane protein YhaH (DUF805 family)